MENISGKAAISLGRLLKSSSLVFSGGAAASLIAFLQNALVVRELGAESYGAWAVVVSFCTITRNLLSFRTQEPLTRYIVAFKAQGRPSLLLAVLGGSLAIDFATALASVAVVALLSPWAGSWMINESVPPHLFWLYGLTVALGFAENTWFSVARDGKAYRRIAAMAPAFAVLQLLLTLALLVGGNLTLLTLAVSSLLVSAAKLSVWSVQLSRWCRSAYGIDLRDFRWRLLGESRLELTEYWAFMKATYAWSTVSALAKNADMLIMGFFRSDAEVGLYKLAKGLISQIQSVSISLSTVIYQDFNEVLTGKKQGIPGLKLAKALAQWTALVVLGFAAAALASPWLIAWIYGDAFGPASIPFSILAIGSGFSTAFFWAQPMLLALGRIGQSSKIIIVTGMASVAACLFLVPLAGQLGAAWSVTAWWASCSSALAIACLLELPRQGEAAIPESAVAETPGAVKT